MIKDRVDEGNQKVIEDRIDEGNQKVIKKKREKKGINGEERDGFEIAP